MVHCLTEESMAKDAQVPAVPSDSQGSSSLGGVIGYLLCVQRNTQGPSGWEETLLTTSSGPQGTLRLLQHPDTQLPASAGPRRARRLPCAPVPARGPPPGLHAYR